MKSTFKQLFSPKITLEKDIFEKSKLLISYRLTLFLSIALGLLSVVLMSFFTLPHSFLTISGFALCFLSFLYISKTGKYLNIMLSFNLLGCFLCVFTLYFVKDQPRIVDGLWMIISCSFSFLTVGKRWGTIITVINTIALSGFFLFFYNEQIALIHQMNENQIAAFSFNILICFSVIYYFNWQSIKTNKEAQNQLKEAHLFLENQFEIINKQNNEKTILLKEVHHRVKNNLQVIVSLLRLQSKDLTSEIEIKTFNESINRVITMSMIHEKIYQSEELASVNIEDYLKSLAENLIKTYQIDLNINLVISSKIKSLDLKPIVPLALIFNELFSNSLKYAFNETEFPKIEVRLKQIENDSLEFIYYDNGNWKEPVTSSSFGLSLIEALSEQLNGTYEMDTKSGTKYTFHFENINS